MNANQTSVALSPDSLFSRISGALCLATLAGDKRPVDAFVLARDLWDQFPALFPDFAECIAAEPLSPRGACWALAADLQHTPGAWDLWTRATDLAAEHYSPRATS